MPEPEKNKRGEIFKGLSLLTQIGFSIVACVLIGVLFGRFLDRVLGTSPWLLMVFSIAGVAAAFKTLYELLKNK